MPSAEDYRKKAEALHRLAIESLDQDEALIYTLRALEFETMAEQAESGQVRQQPDRPLPARPQQEQQPAQQQQQQQAQAKTEDE